VTVPDTDRYSDLGFDATYQYANEDQSALTVNASYIRENQNCLRLQRGGVGAAIESPEHLRLDASFTYHQTWSAGCGVFDITGARIRFSTGPRRSQEATMARRTPRLHPQSNVCRWKDEFWGAPW